MPSRGLPSRLTCAPFEAWVLAADVDWSASRVLELGCGHALPSLAALRRGATQLTLHDASRELLTDVPHPRRERLASDLRPHRTEAGVGKVPTSESLQDMLLELPAARWSPSTE